MECYKNGEKISPVHAVDASIKKWSVSDCGRPGFAGMQSRRRPSSQFTNLMRPQVACGSPLPLPVQLDLSRCTAQLMGR